MDVDSCKPGTREHTFTQRGARRRLTSSYAGVTLGPGESRLVTAATFGPGCYEEAGSGSAAGIDFRIAGAGAVTSRPAADRPTGLPA